MRSSLGMLKSWWEAMEVVVGGENNGNLEEY